MSLTDTEIVDRITGERDRAVLAILCDPHNQPLWRSRFTAAINAILAERDTAQKSVAIPEPTSTRYTGDEHEPADRLAWTTPDGGWSACVWDDPEVQLSQRLKGYWEIFEPIGIDEARNLAAALLAAADAAERIAP